MGRNSYIKTKQEVLIKSKNLSTTINTMINHIEEIEKYKNIKNQKSNDRYYYYKDTNFLYIIFYPIKDIGKYIVEMKESLQNILPTARVLYIRRYAQKNMQDTEFIKKKIKEIDNIKQDDIQKVQKLIDYFHNKKGKNTFFELTKTNCIQLISETIKNKIKNKTKNRNFTAKKIYTMLLNKINLVDKIVEDKVIENVSDNKQVTINLNNYTSNYQRSKIETEQRDILLPISNQYERIIEEIREINLFTQDSLQEYQAKYYSPYRQLYHYLELLDNIDFDDPKYYLESSNGIKYYHLDFDTQPISYYMLDDYGNPLSLEERDRREKELYEKRVENKQRESDPQYLREIYHTKGEIETYKTRFTKIANKLVAVHQVKVIYTKIQRSISLIFDLIDLLSEYFEIKKFGKENDYKRKSTLIKKFYKNKIENLKKYRGEFDEYIDNRKLRLQKVLLIEYLDKFIIENKYILFSIFNMDKDASYEYMQTREADINVFMQELEKVLYKDYYNDNTMLEKQLKKLDKIEFLYYDIQDLKVDTSIPRRIITRTTQGVELFNVYNYKNNLHPKFRLPKNILSLDYEFHEDDFIPFIPDKEYFIKRNFS